MYFLTEDNDLLEKYNTIQYKVSADIKKEFDSEPECKYIEKKVVRHIYDNLSDFSYSSDESD